MSTCSFKTNSPGFINLDLIHLHQIVIICLEITVHHIIYRQYVYSNHPTLIIIVMFANGKYLQARGVMRWLKLIWVKQLRILLKTVP